MEDGNEFKNVPTQSSICKEKFNYHLETYLIYRIPQNWVHEVVFRHVPFLVEPSLTSSHDPKTMTMKMPWVELGYVVESKAIFNNKFDDISFIQSYNRRGPFCNVLTRSSFAQQTLTLIMRLLASLFVTIHLATAEKHSVQK